MFRNLVTEDPSREQQLRTRVITTPIETMVRIIRIIDNFEDGDIGNWWLKTANKHCRQRAFCFTRKPGGATWHWGQLAGGRGVRVTGRKGGNSFQLVQVGASPDDDYHLDIYWIGNDNVWDCAIKRYPGVTRASLVSGLFFRFHFLTLTSALFQESKLVTLVTLTYSGNRLLTIHPDFCWSGRPYRWQSRRTSLIINQKDIQS